jgi:hypothetical protein
VDLLHPRPSHRVEQRLDLAHEIGDVLAFLGRIQALHRLDRALRYGVVRRCQHACDRRKLVEPARQALSPQVLQRARRLPAPSRLASAARQRDPIRRIPVEVTLDRGPGRRSPRLAGRQN